MKDVLVTEAATLKKHDVDDQVPITTITPAATGSTRL